MAFPFANPGAVARKQIASCRRRLDKLLATVDGPSTALFRPAISDAGKMVHLRMAMVLANYFVGLELLVKSTGAKGERIFMRAP